MLKGIKDALREKKKVEKEVQAAQQQQWHFAIGEFVRRLVRRELERALLRSLDQM